MSLSVRALRASTEYVFLRIFPLTPVMVQTGNRTKRSVVVTFLCFVTVRDVPRVLHEIYFIEHKRQTDLRFEK